jgi:NAD+ synthase (glutamine-hydrolysing)
MTTLRIAQAQINPTVGDLAANAEKIARGIAAAREQGAHVVTFPECAISGYPPEDLILRPAFLNDCRRVLERVVIPATKGIVAIVGFPEADGDTAHNAAAVIRDGALETIYRKRELPNYGVFDEKRVFAPGVGDCSFEVAGVRMAVTICEDIWASPSAAVQCAREAGAAVVLNISASPFHVEKLEVRRSLLSGLAERASAVVCYNNLVGGQDELIFDGGSLVVNARGKVVAAARRFAEDMLICDLLIEGGEVRDATPVGRGLAPDLTRLEEIQAALVLGVRDYTRKNGFEKVVVGMSGGIDSALTAALAVEALGAENVIGVTMPSRYTSDETLTDAGRSATALGIRLITLPLGKVHEAYLAEMGEVLAEGAPGLAGENLQARIRGNYLMALSNRHGWLVLTTGNKSEIAVGYCTLYGDTAGGFAVIKDVPKTTVYALSEQVNAHAGREIIPASVIARPPTAELRPNQRDTDSLPPYEVLDPILQAYVEEDRSPTEIAAMGFDLELVRRIAGMVDRNEYKRRQAAPGVKITPKAFGRDRRLPITNRYRAE